MPKVYLKQVDIFNFFCYNLARRQDLFPPVLGVPVYAIFALTDAQNKVKIQPVKTEDSIDLFGIVHLMLLGAYLNEARSKSALAKFEACLLTNIPLETETEADDIVVSLKYLGRDADRKQEFVLDSDPHTVCGEHAIVHLMDNARRTLELAQMRVIEQNMPKPPDDGRLSEHFI